MLQGANDLPLEFFEDPSPMIVTCVESLPSWLSSDRKPIGYIYLYSMNTLDVSIYVTRILRERCVIAGPLGGHFACVLVHGRPRSF